MLPQPVQRTVFRADPFDQSAGLERPQRLRDPLDFDAHAMPRQPPFRDALEGVHRTGVLPQVIQKLVVHRVALRPVQAHRHGGVGRQGRGQEDHDVSVRFVGEMREGWGVRAPTRGGCLPQWWVRGARTSERARIELVLLQQTPEVAALLARRLRRT